jgi:hypothetical protein
MDGHDGCDAAWAERCGQAWSGTDEADNDGDSLLFRALVVGIMVMRKG